MGESPVRSKQKHYFKYGKIREGSDMAQKAAIGIKRFFTKSGVDAYSLIDWVKVESRIDNPMTGDVVFEQKNVEYPKGWSLNAINIVSQKYFAGTPGEKDREGSLKQLIDRVADTVTRHGLKEGYFANEAEAETFNQELKYIVATQRAAFNSPVWFNIGVPDRAQQASACFILHVEDDMGSILDWYRDEGVIFKGGSGAGANISKLVRRMKCCLTQAVMLAVRSALCAVPTR